MVGWHHWLSGHEFEQAPGVSDGQGSLPCCSPWGHKESDTTDWLNWTSVHIPKWVKINKILSMEDMPSWKLSLGGYSLNCILPHISNLPDLVKINLPTVMLIYRSFFIHITVKIRWLFFKYVDGVFQLIILPSDLFYALC